jgi:hypothetical protein
MRPTGGSVVSTQACTRLPEFQHQVLMGFCEQVSKKGHSLRHPRTIAVSLGCTEQDIRDVLPDLDGFVELDAETGRWTIHDKCACRSKGLVKKLWPGSFDFDPTQSTTVRSTPVGGRGAQGECKRALKASEASRAQASLPSRKGGVGGNQKSPTTSRDLSFYWLSKAPPEIRLGCNRKALSGAFTQWKQEGIEPATIVAAIDTFMENPGTIKTSAWRKFLYLKNGLLDQARDRLKQRAGEDHRFDDSDEYWLGRRGAC